jgi:lipopolysaccharide transport system permease protein
MIQPSVKIPSVPRNEASETGALTEPTIVIQPHPHLLTLDFKAIWEYRELLYFLVWRDVKVRYRQTVFGIAWAILQPLMTMVVFTAIFSKFAQIPSDGLPYPVFIYSALLPWNLFANSLNRGSDSVVSNTQLVSKIYFPRLILPLAGTLSPLVDFSFAFSILVGMMIWFQILPTWGILALPLFILLAILTALAVGLWLSALNVRYRDVGHAVPFLIQLWLFASPVAYPVSLIPEKWRLLYSLNPIVGVVEGFRWALRGKETVDFGVIAISSTMVLTLLLPGIIYFRFTERTFADVI